MGSGRFFNGIRSRRLIAGLGAFVLIAVVGVSAIVSYAATHPGDDNAPAVEQLTATLSPPPTPAPTARPTPQPTPSPEPTPFFAGTTYHLVIDKIGVDAPVVEEGMDADNVPVVPLDGYDVAWYDFTSQPGAPGNAVFAAHKTWDGQAVFYNLDQLVKGDTIRLEGPNNSELVYTVTDSFTVDENDPNAVQVMAETQDDVMTLISCDGDRYYTGDPVFGHDYTLRRIVRAEPTAAVPASIG